MNPKKGLLKCFYSNVDSFINKRAEFYTILECERPDIVCLSEILPKNCSNPVQPAEIQLDNYDCFTNIGETQCHLGVGIWTKKCLQAQPVTLSKDHSKTQESTWCEIPLDQGDRLLVGCIYRSPNSTEENNNQVNQLLKDMTMNRSHTLVTGDFNHPQIDWKEGTSPSDEKHKSSKFLESVRDAFLFQHVRNPTHARGDQEPHVLDLIFTNEEGMVSEVRHEAPVGKSHHHSLCFEFRCYTPKTDNAQHRLNFAKGDYNKLRSLVQEQNLTQQISDRKVSEAWDFFKSSLETAMASAIPKVKSGPRAHKKPLWMNEDALKKVKKKRQAYQRYLQTREGKDYLLYASARNKVKSASRRALKDFEKSIAKSAKSNPKGFFAYARNKLRTREGVADLEADGVKITTDEGKANVLNDFFCSVFTVEDLQNKPECEEKSFESPLQSLTVTADDVKKQLQSLNPNKSPGPDGLHPMVLKELSDVLAEPVAELFNKTMQEGELPPQWKEAHVTPIFKKGTKSKPGNYRPVSLTCILCKVMETLVRDKLLAHMNSNKLLSKCQHGFVAGRSCSTNLLAVLDDWTKLLDEGCSVDTVYLDFAKAFDSVPHERLLDKLQAYGVRGEVHRWIRAFLTGRSQRVCVNGVQSEWAQVRSGVPQGSVLGPVLFVAFINDLPDVVSSICKMYADDTKVYRQVVTDEDREKLQKDLDELVKWADKWQLRFNAEKCKVLHLGSKNSNFQYSMKKHGSDENVTLEATSLEKDLGVNVDQELKFSKHTEIQVNKANRILGLVRRSYEYLDCESMKHLFCALVRPHLEFSNVAWAPKLQKDKDLIEGVLRRATRVIPGMGELSYEERLKKINLPSMAYRRARGDMIEVYKYTHNKYAVESPLVLMDEDSTTRGHSYKLDKVRCKTTVRQEFFSYRVVNTWNSLPEKVVSAPTINSFKNRLDAHWKHLRYCDRIED